MVPIIQFWIILEHMYKKSQNLQAFFNEHVHMYLLPLYEFSYLSVYKTTSISPTYLDVSDPSAFF